MPKKSELMLSTDRQVAGAAGPPSGQKYAEYRIEGTPNLVLRVTKAGRRTWVYWVKRGKTNRWQKLTIGTYPAKTLALAKQDSIRYRLAVLDGMDPVALRDASRSALTVEDLGDTYIRRHAKPKKKSWADDERKLKREVYPKLGSSRADQITKSEIVLLLNGIHDRGAPVQANRTLALIRKMFNWAVAEGMLTASPALGIPARAKEDARTRSLNPDEIGAFWMALDTGVLEEVTADALRLQFLLGARIREITGMARTELSKQGHLSVWTLPKERAKAGRDIPRPLPPMAQAIIARRIKAAGKSAHVFASPANLKRPLTARAPSNALRRAGEAGKILSPPAVLAKRGVLPSGKPVLAKWWRSTGFTPHDLRRTCRTGLAKLGVNETVAKKILGHAPARSDVTASVYDQHTYLPEMFEALERWERQICCFVASQSQEDAA